MRYLMKYEGYTAPQRLDDILDKISKRGIESLSPLEKKFLDSHKSGGEEEMHSALTQRESESFFEDDSGMFTFEFDSSEDYEDEIHYLGTLTCPDLLLDNGKTVSGALEGRIVFYKENGAVSPDFWVQIDGADYDVFDFCEGYEYELDNFIDYIVQEIKESEDDE